MLPSIFIIPTEPSGPPLWVDVLVNLGSATLGGIVSGLIVAWAVKRATRRSKPLFEYFNSGHGDGTAHLFYNGTKPIVIGGSYAHHHGPALFERSPRAEPHGFFMEGQSNQVFSTSGGQGSELSPGERIEVVYRHAPREMVKNHEARYEAFSMACDPTKLLSAHSRIREAKEKGETPDPRDVKMDETWMSEVVNLLPSSTRIAE
ncbi:hypothetical protein [Corynebacterium casei]|uniref:hypothetical protein n=1 Tax=Corynebacterium casei TaxID=160386 RepID=UPI003FD65B34